ECYMCAGAITGIRPDPAIMQIYNFFTNCQSKTAAFRFPEALVLCLEKFNKDQLLLCRGNSFPVIAYPYLPFVFCKIGMYRDLCFRIFKRIAQEIDQYLFD